MNKDLLEVLDDLKKKGLSATSRTFLASEWLNYHVDFLGDKNHENYTTFHKRAQNVSSKIKEMISNIKDENDFNKNYDLHLQNIFFHGFSGNDLSLPMELKREGYTKYIDFVKNIVQDFDNNRFSGFDYDALLDVFSSVGVSAMPKYQLIKDMYMGEEDLQIYLNKKMPQIQGEYDNHDNLSIDEALLSLEKARQRASIPIICLDYFTQSNPQAIMDIANGIEKTCDAFESLGVKGFGLNKIDLNVDLPYQGGNSGVMSSHYKPTPLCPISTPTIALSNNSGWSQEEVIIHEALHAHDALLASVFRPSLSLKDDEENSRGKTQLLSDMLENKLIDLASNPIAKAWIDVEVKIKSLIESEDVIKKKKNARNGILSRWDAFIPSKYLNEAISLWESSTDKNKDVAFIKKVDDILSQSNFAASSSFRGAVVLSELKLLEKLNDEPTFVTFNKNFDNVLNDLIAKGMKNEFSSYGKGYFESMAETMARSIQSSLDAGANTNDENPYAKRWLVYPSSSLSTQITAIWKDFFANEEVKKVYEFLSHTSSNLDTLADNLKLFRKSKESTQALSPKIKL